jgi:hypothetical protein
MSKFPSYSIKNNTEVHSETLSFESKYQNVHNSFVFAIRKSHSFEWIEGEINEYTQDIFEILAENSDKELIYIRAIKNLLKQKEFLNLQYLYSNEMITDDEFSQELDENEDKYLIHVDNDLNNKSFDVLCKVLKKINLNFTDDDLSEIFSVRTHNIINLINTTKEIQDEDSSR